MSTKEKNKVLIFDTTLRDGEQSPGATMSLAQKIEIASLLDEMGVDIIEAGFPIASEGDFEAVSKIGKSVKSAKVCGLARASKLDIERCWRAVENSINPRIHTFIGTSPLHREFQVKLSKEEVLDKVFETVTFAKSFCDDVQWSPMDATRTESEFLVEVVKIAIQAGASTINIPDTVGYTAPKESANIIKNLFLKIPELKNIIVSTHCHNDLGMATANSLAAVEAGARQVECTINGIGERAGNASLEEIVMSLNVRSDYWPYKTDIKTKEIHNSSKMVSKHTGMIVQANKAIVGDNAFAHESGIHQDGFLKNRKTYEIMTPESVGLNKSKIILGRHSGRHGIQSRLAELGYELSNRDMNNVYKRFLELADKKKEIFDDDLRILMGDRNIKKNNAFDLDYLHVAIGTNTIPTATVRIKTSDSIVEESATGDGPVAASFKAIKRALKLDYDIKLHDYKVRSITSGKDAFGEVIIRLFINDTLYVSKGTSTDTIKASVKAYLDALNQYERDKKSRYLLYIEEPVNV